MLTQPSKISPEADFGNFSKSLQKERTAIFSEILSRIHPSTFQTEPRCEKHIFRVFLAKIQSLVFETQHVRIIFQVLDLHLGCLVLEAHFPRTCSKSIDFYTVWEPPGILKRMKRMKAKWYTTGSSDPRFLTRLRSGWRQLNKLPQISWPCLFCNP